MTVVTTQELADAWGLRFGSEDLQHAWKDWQCNCGPAAIAAATRSTLDEVRRVMPGFEQKGYTSPVMMRQALAKMGVDYEWTPINTISRDLLGIPPGHPAVVRIQWEGPWTAKGANPRWAYKHTHWHAAAVIRGRISTFDVNMGPQLHDEWAETVPGMITSTIARATGGWFITHVVTLEKWANPRT